MAAQDYYNSFAPGPSGPQPSQQRPPQSPHTQPLFPASAYPPQTPPQQGLSKPPSEHPSHPPPPYSPYQQQQQQQHHQSPQQRPFQPQQAPPPQSQSPFYPPPQAQQSLYQPQQQPQAGYLAPPGHDANGSPLKPARSYSSPPDERRHHSHHHHHSDDSSRSRSRSRSRSGSHSHERYTRDGYDRSAHHRKDKAHHKDMDTFLGAGGGAIIGDAIFPGLGTIGGLILGGYGGREYAKKQDAKHRRDKELRDEYRDERRSRSSAPDYRYERRDSGKY